jgi:hypothetical protein
MNIGFFADDSSACHAALLANNAFLKEGRSDTGILAGGSNIVDAVPAYLDEAAGSNRNLMVALPLAQLDNTAIRSRLDLAVVAFGPDPLAHDGARRVMASKAVQPTDGLPPAWMLAACGRALPDAPRALPIRIGALRRSEASSLRSGCTCASIRWRAVGLAATLLIAADDPYATRIDPARVVQAVTSGATVAEIGLRADLLDLAAELDERTADMAYLNPHRRRPTGPFRRIARRGSGRAFRECRKPLPAPVSAASRHSADCACSVPV